LDSEDPSKAAEHVASPHPMNIGDYMGRQHDTERTNDMFIRTRNTGA
jgi:hypothetical protein